MYRDLSDKVVVFTGIGQIGDQPMWGNGAAIAKVFACENGAKVFGCDSDFQTAEHTKKRIEAEGGVCDVTTCDVTDQGQVEEFVRSCMEKYGRVEISINNVGRSEPGGPAELSESAWNRQTDVNLKSVYLTCHFVLPIMEKQKSGVSLGVHTKYLQVDVTKEDALTKAFDDSANEFKTLDGSVTAAGILPGGAFVEQSWEGLRKILEVNVVGSYFSAQLATKQMIKRGTGGSIVMFASIAAHEVVPGAAMSAYNASKAGIKMLASSLNTELGPHQIRVDSISPGTIQTDMVKPILAANEQMSHIVQTTPALKRAGWRNDITPAVIYFLSDASSWTTGVDMLVTGGLHGGRLDYP
ncbi:hypothetical protein FOBRF1_009138 [Fusarium oxysporum]